MRKSEPNPSRTTPLDPAPARGRIKFPYSFVVLEPAADKIRFVHEVIERSAPAGA
jgi:hypothetical protein